MANLIVYKLTLDEVTPGPATTLEATVAENHTVTVERTSVAHSTLPLATLKRRLRQMLTFVEQVEELAKLL